MRASPRWLWLLLLPSLVSAGEATRFSGAGVLVAKTAASADGRYALQAALRPGDRNQQGGRFSVVARLDVSDAAKAAATTCTAGPDIFRNGFE